MDFEYELKKAKEKFGENSNVIRLKKINIEEFKEYIKRVPDEKLRMLVDMSYELTRKKLRRKNK